MNSKVALLNRITYYIVNRKGKQMRPMFVFLTAKMISGGEVLERTYRGALVIELIHTATLVHDDVVDDSNRRRGFFSINALWKNKIAVLVGDYLLSKGLLLSIDNGDFDLLKIISVAVREMSEGELLQIEKARRLDITEEVYYDIIRQKTATLIAACCALGAKSVSEDEILVEKMRKFGELIGMAFQIKDDLFDYSEEAIGKPTGIDIKEQKFLSCPNGIQTYVNDSLGYCALISTLWLYLVLGLFFKYSFIFKSNIHFFKISKMSVRDINLINYFE